MRKCGNCGSNPVPYPLSTGPDCGDPWYKIRCSAGTLWFDALAGSSYMIRSIDPLTRRIITRPATLAPKTCVSTDFHSEGMHLNETLPFSVASGNTIFLYNCTAHAPAMNCAASSACHKYAKEHAEFGACGRVGVCCEYKSGGARREYAVLVHGGGCAAYQSFVDFNGTAAEGGVGIEWVAPQEPVCRTAVDCKELVNSKCGVGPGGGVQRCFCNAGFKWDPVNGLCQPQIQRHGKDNHCKVRKKKKMLLAVVVSLGGIVSIITVIGAIFYKKHNAAKTKKNEAKTKRRTEISTTKASALSSRIFTGREIMKATNNFAPENLIGSGGFGEVFKGTFDDGTVFAIKRAKLGSTKGIDQMQNEVRILCQVNHRSLVRLLGCCMELEHPMLIYEYVSNGTLFDYLHRHSCGEFLKWHQRLKIAHQTAEGLSYLHSSAVPPIYHRDVKSSNILLDEKFDAKVSDFGLSRLVELAEENKSHIFTSAQGTLGYLDPEYYRNFQLTDKSDVYSFGVVLMELLTAQKAIDFNREEESVNLAMYGKRKMVEDKLMDVVDPLLREGASEVELETMKSLGYLAVACLDEQRQKRPSMKEVADEIEYLIKIVKGQVSKS
uniref:Wall-associated receptor kinase-like 20 n=1 Tax=Cajanus cajan TaxID=3821 RepID=A0A151THK6_CAJCA|nr:Wall-associated receptor kinase-like 20 [Cajanus cajan]